MKPHQIGEGYFGFEPSSADKTSEADWVDKVYKDVFSSPRSEALKMRERFHPSRRFLEVYGDCIQNLGQITSDAEPIVYCSAPQARVMRTLMDAFQRAIRELPADQGENSKKALPALVGAWLRNNIPAEELDGTAVYRDALSKDPCRQAVRSHAMPAAVAAPASSATSRTR